MPDSRIPEDAGKVASNGQETPHAWGGRTRARWNRGGFEVWSLKVGESSVPGMAKGGPQGSRV